jgi:hypothetical protein
VALEGQTARALVLTTDYTDYTDYTDFDFIRPSRGEAAGVD